MRIVAWLLIFHQFVWLNVFVPAHTRGAITLPAGVVVAQSASPVEEEMSAVSCCSTKKQASADGKPTREQKSRCAVCRVVDGYTVPPVFDFDLPLTGRAFEGIRLLVAQVGVIDFAFPFFPIGPPGH